MESTEEQGEAPLSRPPPARAARSPAQVPRRLRGLAAAPGLRGRVCPGPPGCAALAARSGRG